MASTMRLNAVRPAAAPVARRRAAARSLVRAAATGDIVDTAAAAGSFKTLLAAATAAGLVDTLKAAGPMTVFAPTDAAFAALPAGTVERLLKPENKEELVAILTCVQGVQAIYLIPIMRGSAASPPPLATKGLPGPPRARAARATGRLRREGACAALFGTGSAVLARCFLVRETLAPSDTARLPQLPRGEGQDHGPPRAQLAQHPHSLHLGCAAVLSRRQRWLTRSPADVKMFVDTKTGGKGVTIVGSKEVGKQGLNAAIIGGKIVQTDIECTNGIIHVVDAVLIPFKARAVT